eukprot:Skav223209  [mRNA]  locus=scaffold2072:206144:209877:+ [translate_table: standard]
MGTLGEAKELLASKKYDYCGAPLEYMEDLVMEKVEPAWPKPGEAGVQEITKYVSGPTQQALDDPKAMLLPPDKMPVKSLRSRVRASDTEWFKICKLAHERGLMKIVDDDDIPRDRSGHLVTNGAGGVKKEKTINGKKVMCQRFISILCPTNSVTMPIEGAQNTLPFIGTMTAIQLEEEEMAYLDSEDLQSAFNLFAMPSKWLPFFAYSKKVDSSAFGLEPGKLVRPALAVVPMGWHSAVGIVQEAVRSLVFERAGASLSSSIEKGKPLPKEKDMSIVYLDNFDEIHVVKKASEDLRKEGVELSPFHQKFIDVCDEDGLPRNLGKQLVHSYAGGLQGGLLDGMNGVLRVAPDKMVAFLKISVALLCSKRWSEFHLRHWAGKAAFIAAFRRLLYAFLESVFPLIERSRTGNLVPTSDGIDEILVVMGTSVIAQSDLRARLSTEISCTDASPTGGASAIATKFKSRTMTIPAAKDFDVCCCVCDEELVDGWTYPCSRKCGARACSPMCIFTHTEKECRRKDMYTPTFGERFAGANFPLTQAVALQGVAIQPPLDIKIESYKWDFFSEAGKEHLEDMDTDPSLAAKHYAPECKTFSKARGRPIKFRDGRVISGPKALRSVERPWGLSNLSRLDLIKVRQGNAMAKASLKSFKDGITPEAKELLEHPEVFVACYSACCYGGWRTKWTCLITNCLPLYNALHRPECPGHSWLLPYEVHETEQGLQFDTEEEAEYPWEFCMEYAKALRKVFSAMAPSPVGALHRDTKAEIYSVIKRATKGLQNPEVASRVANKVNEVLNSMRAGKEAEHLADLLRQVTTRGCDIKLMTDPEDGSLCLMTPYPAFGDFPCSDKGEELITTTQPSHPPNCRCFACCQPRALPHLDHQQMEFCRPWESAPRPMTKKTHLKFLGVRKRTVQLYKAEVSQFFAFVDWNSWPTATTFSQLDQQVADYVNPLFQEGESISKAGWLLSGLRRFYPRTRRELCLAQQWYTNWTREHVPTRATPITWRLLRAFVGLCWSEGWFHLGLSLLLGFTFFLRTQELLQLRLCDIEVAADNTVVIRLGRTKTSQQHLQALSFCHPLVADLTRCALPQMTSSRLWPCSTTHFRNCLNALSATFEVSSLNLVPYSLRRGGATHFYTQMKTLDFVMIQGRWKDQRTCRLYLDDARAALVNFRFSQLTNQLISHFSTFLRVAAPKVSRG